MIKQPFVYAIYDVSVDPPIEMLFTLDRPLAERTLLSMKADDEDSRYRMEAFALDRNLAV
jgi:hypothetical protein